MFVYSRFWGCASATDRPLQLQTQGTDERFRRTLKADLLTCGDFAGGVAKHRARSAGCYKRGKTFSARAFDLASLISGLSGPPTLRRMNTSPLRT